MKDYIPVNISFIPIIISFISLVVSTIAIIITLHQKKYEIERTLRNQITEVIEKLVSVALEHDKIWFDSGKLKNDPQQQALRARLNDQRRFLVRQAVYLIKQKPKLISDIEYLTVAEAFSHLRDYALADIYWKKAIQASPDDYYKSTNLRNYARFVFSQSSPEMGRQLYQESLSLLSKNSDRDRYLKGETYQRWALMESEFGFLGEAERLFDLSKVTFEKIGDKRWSRHMLSNLEAARQVETNRLMAMSNQPEKLVESLNSAVVAEQVIRPNQE